MEWKAGYRRCFSAGQWLVSIALTHQRFKNLFEDASFCKNIFPFNDQMRLNIEIFHPFVEKTCILHVK
jgi:hypothetical protein